MVKIRVHMHIQPHFLHSHQDVYFPQILIMQFLNGVVDAGEGGNDILEFFDLLLQVLQHILALLVLHAQLLNQLLLLLLVEPNVDVH